MICAHFRVVLVRFFLSGIGDFAPVGFCAWQHGTLGISVSQTQEKTGFLRTKPLSIERAGKELQDDAPLVALRALCAENDTDQVSL